MRVNYIAGLEQFPIPQFLAILRKMDFFNSTPVNNISTGQSSWRDVEYANHAGGAMRFTTPFPLLYLLFLSSIALSQDRPRIPAVPNTCPVTKPADESFVPPQPYPAKPSVGQFWFGTDRLWTALPVTGTWRVGHYTSGDPTFRQKLPFWRQGHDADAEPRFGPAAPDRRKGQWQLDERRSIHHDGYQLSDNRVLGDHGALRE